MANFTLPSFPRSTRPTPPRDALAAAVAELKARLDAASVSFPRLSSAAGLHLVDSHADALALVASLADGDVVLVGGTSWYYVESHALVPFDPSGADARLAALEAKVPPEASPSNQLADRAYIATALAEIVGGAPEAYDTLKEIADWIADDESGAAKIVADVLALRNGKRDRTDLSVDQDKWLLVKPDGAQAWLGRPDPQRDEWVGDGFTLDYDDTVESSWALVKTDAGGMVVDDSAALPPDTNRLEFMGSDGTSVYRLVRGSRLALDTEIPPVDDTVARTSENPVKSSAVWTAIWGALAALPTGFSSLYDWCVAQLAGKLSRRETEEGFTEWNVESIAPSYRFVSCIYSQGSWTINLLYYPPGSTEPIRAIEAIVNGADATELVGDSISLSRTKLRPTKTSELTNDGNGVSPFATVSQIPDISGKADAADLRYRIAEAELTAKLPDSVFPITYTDSTATPQSRTISSADDVEILESTDDFYAIDKQNPDYGGSGRFALFNKTTGVFYGSDAPISDVSFNGATSATLDFARALADRAVNLITATTETSIDIELPAPQTGRSRDFYLAVTCGSTAPTLNVLTGVTLVNAKGEQSDLSLSADATTVLRFTEVKEAGQSASAVFCVTGGANGGGGSLDLSILAGEFSEQATYEEGDIVQHNGDLYVCVLDIETPGTWDDADWSDASPVIPVLLGMIRGKADSSALATKAESAALAPAWISGHAYFKGDHVSYHGLLYECLSTVAGSTDPSADTTHWKQTDLAAPDATLDILSDGRLRVVAADGSPMWTQGYALASESAVALSCEKINKYVFAATTAAAFSDSSTYAVGDRVTYGGKVYKCSTAVETAGAWTGATNWDEDPDTQAFALPNAPSGIVGDFVLDVDNTANEVPVMVAISGTLGTDYDLIVEKGRSSVDVLTIEGGALAELYFTMTAFGTAAKPAWRVVRLNVERQEAGS